MIPAVPLETLIMVVVGSITLPITVKQFDNATKRLRDTAEALAAVEQNVEMLQHNQNRIRKGLDDLERRVSELEQYH